MKYMNLKHYGTLIALGALLFGTIFGCSGNQNGYRNRLSGSSSQYGTYGNAPLYSDPTRFGQSGTYGTTYGTSSAGGSAYPATINNQGINNSGYPNVLGNVYGSGNSNGG